MDTRDDRITALIDAVQRFAGAGDRDPGVAGADSLTELARAVNGAAAALEPQRREAPPSEALTARAEASPVLDDLFRVSLEQAADAVFWMNGDGGFDYVNAQACASLGYTAEELLGLKLWDIDPGMSPKRFVLHWRSYGAPGAAIRRFESVHRRKDGTTFPIEVSSRHLYIGGAEFHVAFTRDISDRKRADEALRLTQFCIDKAAIAIFRLDRAGRIVSANDQACWNLGYSRDELLRMSVFDISVRSPAGWETFLAELRARGSMTFETSHLRKGGEPFPVEVTVNHIDADGTPYLFSFVRDITAEREAELERKALEAQLAHAQRMESIGRLAGGIAHDFNNMLAVILGYTELLKRSLPEGDASRDDLAEIEHAATRSRDITRQLLAFSRKQVVTPRPIVLAETLESTERTLARLVGDEVQLIVEHEPPPTPDPWFVEIDPAQVDQILVNLVVNARDAMPDGGRITVRLSHVELDEVSCVGHLERRPGRFVCLEVADTGHGMTEDVQRHAFEPFFTTKAVGEGTGLGLATIYGIVKQNGGFITVDSAPGEGATFRTYLPRVEVDARDGHRADAGPLRGDETILLVEDDASVRQLTERMLRQLGYDVRTAGTPDEALTRASSGERVDLVLSDVAMPGMSGAELRARLRRRRPDVPTLLMSAHATAAIVRDVEQDGRVGILQKPFSLVELSRAVRHALGARP